MPLQPETLFLGSLPLLDFLVFADIIRPPSKMFPLLLSLLPLLAAANQPSNDDDNNFLKISIHDLVPEPIYPQPPAAPHATAIPSSGGVPCTSTLTVTAPTDCSGCTTTSYAATSTAEVDCQGCGVLTTTTVWDPWVGLCPVSRNPRIDMKGGGFGADVLGLF